MISSARALLQCRSIGGEQIDQAVPVNSRSVATTAAPRYGFDGKTLPAGKSFRTYPHAAGRREDLDRRPPVADEKGELQAVH
jgi:hypothetical protein